MARDWEETFRSWAQAPGKWESEKCEHAETAIRKAIANDATLSQRDVIVFPQGSYRNRTNVRKDSDVDICILCRDTLFTDLPEGMSDSDFGLSDASYHYAAYKDDVERALKSHFGASAVRRGNKAFDIHENSYRVDADAVACFEHRRYRRDLTWVEGTSFLTDKGNIRVNNWPEQNYENGVTKNRATNRGFKGIVRILKRLRNEMAENGSAAAMPIPSFLLECLAWNAPNDAFTHATWTADVWAVLAHLFNKTINEEDCHEWGEINELKYLFRAAQPWTREAAHAFLGAAWDYVGFE